MKFKYLFFISLFLIVTLMTNIVFSKTIDITENHSSNEIKNFFNSDGLINGEKLVKGDTIIFQKGDYGDLNLNIKKSVNIQSKGKVYFDSVIIKSNNIKIKGFDFNNLILRGNRNSIVNSHSNSITIIGNKNKATNSFIERVTIHGSKNIINKNNIYGYNEYGIRVRGSQNKFYKNIISGFEDGIVLMKGTKNLIYKNTLKNHKWNGLFIFSGSYNNKIKKNKFSNDNCGIFHYYRSKNSISRNIYDKVKIKTDKFRERGILRYKY